MSAATRRLGFLAGFVFIVICSFGMPSPLLAQEPLAPSTEWTQEAHDAQRTGYSPEEPLEPWSLLWTWNGPGPDGDASAHAYDAPRDARTITGGRHIYVPAGDHGLYALDKGTGQPAWHLTATSFNAAPAYNPAANQVFAGGSDGHLYRIDADTGRITGEYLSGSPLNYAVLLVPPFAYIVTMTGELHKVDTATMTGIWTYAAGAPTATPASYSASRDVIVYATNDLFVHAVRNADGTASWREKPTSNPAGFPNEFDGYWPVIADQHGVVFLRMRLDHNPGLWGGPGKGGMYPVTNVETRAFLRQNPDLQNLFALSLDTGHPAFTPAVGYGGVEAIVNGEPFLDTGPVPVIRVLPDGTEIAYMIFRSGQSAPPDGRWDSHMGEMALDDTTIPGLTAGDLRFVAFQNSYIHITDEQTPFSMAGDTLFYAHWGASASTRILDRSDARGLTYTDPITSAPHPAVIRRQTACSDFNPLTHWTTCSLQLYGDTRHWDGPGWWVYWNVLDPPTPDREAYSEGLRPRYTYVSNGLVIIEGNGGELFVLKHSGASLTGESSPAKQLLARHRLVALQSQSPTPAPAVRTPHVTSMAASTAQVGRYLKFEVTFQISRIFPTESMLPYYFYDPDDPRGLDGITIDGHFVAPSGRELTVPAFYYQDYVRSGAELTPTLNYSWKLRFAPEEIGPYTYFITVSDREGMTRYPDSGVLAFQSMPSASPGFVRVSPRDPRFLEFSNGDSFIPISAGHQWWQTSTGLRSEDYARTFVDFWHNGINLTRVWDQNDGYALTVEGHFDAYAYPDDFNPEGRDVNINAVPKGTQMNQRGNLEEDAIIEAAERTGVYIQICSHSDPYWIWDASVHDPGAVSWTDASRFRYWQRNFRYRVARWGYSTAVLAWEHWNELGHVPVDSDTFAFYQRYGAYQQQVDPYHHLRTTSQGSQAWSPAFWSSPSFDIANYHDYMMISRYSPDLTYDAANFVYRFAQCLRTVNGSECGLGLGDGSDWQGPPKPYIWGELDTGTAQWNEANPRQKATHDMRWAGLFSPLGTSPIDWYWDFQNEAFIATKYREASIAADFFHGLDYAGKAFTYLSTDDVRLTSEPIATSSPQLRVLAMRSGDGREAYAWAQNRDHARWDSDAVPAPLNATFTISHMAAGAYHLVIWDTYTGQINDGGLIEVSDGALTIALNGLTKDVALKILPAG